MKAILSEKTRITIQFYDLDPMSVCWHGNYVRFFEQARCALLRKIEYDYPQMNESGFYWPVIDLQIRYIKTLTYGQEVDVVANLVEYENYLKTEYEIFDSQSGDRLPKGMTKQVAVRQSDMEMQLVSPKVLVQKVKKVI